MRFPLACLAFTLAVASVIAAIVFAGMVGAGPTMVRAFEAWGAALLASALAWRLAASGSPAWLRRASAVLFFLLGAASAYWVAMVVITRPAFG